jgi:hypothetical protein
MENKTVLLILEIKQPDGSLMSIPDNQETLQVNQGSSNSTAFKVPIQLYYNTGNGPSQDYNVSKYLVNVDVYSTNQSIKYYTTGFSYSFTPPFDVYFFFQNDVAGFHVYMTVDGVTYQSEVMHFYWCLGTNHTIAIPNIVYVPGSNASWRYSWGDNVNSSGDAVMNLTVTENMRTAIEFYYAPNL